MAPKEKPKGPAAAKAKPPAKGAAKAKGVTAAGKAKQPASGRASLVPAVPKPRTSGRLSGPIDPGAIQSLDAPQDAFTAGQAPSRSASVSISGSDVTEETHELRQERDELQAENIRLQRKASQANAVVTKVNDLMDRFQLRDKQQRKELEAAQEQASEQATLQAEHRRSITGLEEHAALLQEQLTVLRGPTGEDSAVSLKAALPDTGELESELAESRKGNLVAKEAMARAKTQLMHQKEQVEEIAHLSQSELAEVAEVKLELEEAIRGRQLYEEEASSERRICQRLQSEAVSGAIGASELESQAAGDGGLHSWMWRWARLTFLAHSESVDRSCAELIHAATEATARKHRASTAFSFTPGAGSAVQPAATPAAAVRDSSPTASTDSAMALALQEALAGVQEAKATMSRALQETEAECAYWASRARQLEERAEQAEAQVRELKEAVLKASALGRATAEKAAERAVVAQSPDTKASEAPADALTAKEKESVKVTVLKMQLASLKAIKAKAQNTSPNAKMKKVMFPRSTSGEGDDLDSKVELQQQLDEALFNLTQEQNALHAAEATAAECIREHDAQAFKEYQEKGANMQQEYQEQAEAMQQLTRQESEALQRIEDKWSDEMKAMEATLAEATKATEAGWTQAAEELISAVENAKVWSQTEMSEYEEAWSSQRSGLVSELTEAVFSKIREATDLQSEVEEVEEKLHNNALEDKVQQMEQLVSYHEHVSETAETERDHLQEEMFKCMEDSMTTAHTIQASSDKIREHLLAELAEHGADMEKHAQTATEMEAESKAIALSTSNLANALNAAKESPAKVEAEELYSLAEEKISEMLESSKAEEEECAKLASIRERAVAAELATQQVHTAECSLYRLAEEGRIGAKQDLEEYTKERRLLEDLLAEKSEEAERLSDEVDELRGDLKIEREKSERMESLAEVARAEDANAAPEIHHLREELVERSQAADAGLGALRDELNAEVRKVREELDFETEAAARSDELKGEILKLQEELDSETEAAARSRMHDESHHSAAGKAVHGVAEVAKGIGHAVEDAARHVSHSHGTVHALHTVEGAAKGIAQVDGTIHAMSGLFHHVQDRPDRVSVAQDGDGLESQRNDDVIAGGTEVVEAATGEAGATQVVTTAAREAVSNAPPHELPVQHVPHTEKKVLLDLEADSEKDFTGELTLEREISAQVTSPQASTSSSHFSLWRGRSKSPRSGTDADSSPSHSTSKLGAIRAMAKTFLNKGNKHAQSDELATKENQSDPSVAAPANTTLSGRLEPEVADPGTQAAGVSTNALPVGQLEPEVAAPKAQVSGHPSDSDKESSLLKMELAQEKLARADALAQRLRVELAEERLARESSVAKAPSSGGTSSAAERHLEVELEQERVARADALTSMQSDHASASVTNEELRLELRQERMATAIAVAKLESTEGSPSDKEHRLRNELEQERLARADATAISERSEYALNAVEGRLRSELEQERLANALPSATLQTGEGISQLAEELSERNESLSKASAELAELRSAGPHLLQDPSPSQGLVSELRVQNAALRFSLESRIEQGASMDEVLEASRPGVGDAASIMELQRRERMRWASEVDELRQELAASTSEAQRVSSGLSQGDHSLPTTSAVAHAVQQEFAQEWASEAALMKTAEDAQLEAVAALAEYAEELQEHETLLQAASLQASEFREGEVTRQAGGRSSGSRSGSIVALRTQVGQLENMLDESCKEQRRLESVEAAAHDASEAVAAAFDAQQAAAARAEHFTSETSELRSELLRMVDRADSADRAVTKIVALKIQVAALVKLIEKAEAEALSENGQVSWRQSLQLELTKSQNDHFDAMSENFAYAEQLETKDARFRECASELSHLRNSTASLLDLRDVDLRQKEAQSAEYESELAELRASTKALVDSATAELRERDAQSAEVVFELAELRRSAKAAADAAKQELRTKEVTCTAKAQAESELCAWWQAQSMQQEARAENLQRVLQNMASTEIDEVNRLREQLATNEGQPQVRAARAVAAPSSIPEDSDSFQHAVAARMGQPALVAAAAGHIEALAEDAARKAAEAKQMVEQAELRNDEELQVHRDLCAHWEAVAMSHAARAEQLQGVEAKEARKVTEQLHGEEARAAKLHTWDHLLASRVSAEEAKVAELRGEVNALSGRLKAAEKELEEKDAEYRDLHDAEEHHARQGSELHGQLHFQGSQCLEVHATASEMQTQVALMQRRLSEQSVGFRKFEDVAAHELMQARAEVQHESGRMLAEAAELRSEMSRCGIVSAQEAAVVAAHASALCDVQLTAHKVHADHNAEHECLRVEHGSEVQAAKEHQEVSARLLRELEEHQHELTRKDFVVQEHEARAQVHHDIAEVRAVELGHLKRRLCTEEEAWWSSERACAMAHGALERVAQSQDDVTATDKQTRAAANAASGAPAFHEQMSHSVVAADVALGQAMSTLQNAADSVMDAHFSLRSSPQKPHEEPVVVGSYVDLGKGYSNESEDHGDEVPRSALGWLLPPSSGPPTAPHDERLGKAENVLIMAGAALRASADALRDSRSDLERATLRHNLQAVACWSLSAEDSAQADPPALDSIDDPMMAHSTHDTESHSRSRLTAAAQGVFIAAASKKKPATMEYHAADLARRAHAQLCSEHYLLEAEVASERHEASSLQAKVEQMQLNLITEEHRSVAGCNAAREEMMALKQEQALQLQEATVRLWELSQHLEDRNTTVNGQPDGPSVTDAARLHTVAATEVHRAEAAEESARERYEELQRLVLGVSAMNAVDDAASPASAAAASVTGQQSLELEEKEEEEEGKEEPVLLHSAPALTLAEVEIEAMHHQEESQALQQECAEMLEEIRQHAPNLDLAWPKSGLDLEWSGLPDTADLHVSPRSNHEHGEGLWISSAPAELGRSAEQLCRAVDEDSQRGAVEMQHLTIHAQHLVAAAALKHKGELLASEEECELLRKRCEHHLASEKHMQAAASAGSAEAQELAAYLAVEEAAWRATHESSCARHAEHARANQHLEEVCNTLTQRNTLLSERHDEVVAQLDDYSSAELDAVRTSLLRQRRESAELQDCLMLADVQAESTTAKLVDVNLKQQAYAEECDAREATLVAELAALRDDGDMERAKLLVELKQREDSTEESCREFEQTMQRDAEQREAELRDEVNSEARKCTEFMAELETCIRDLSDLQAHASELTELHRMRDTRSIIHEEGLQRTQEEMLHEASMRSIALEAETTMQEALVTAAEERSHLEETFSKRERSHTEERRRLEAAVFVAKEEQIQLEAFIKRQQRGSDGNEAEVELRQARTEINALEQIAELHAQHSLKVHRLMCEDAQQRVAGGSTRPVRNSALRQWQARVADQSQMLLERSWTLLHRPDSPTGAGVPHSEMAAQRHADASTASLRSLEDARGDAAAVSVTGTLADTAT